MTSHLLQSKGDQGYFLVPVILSIVALVIQIATNTNYGIFTSYWLWGPNQYTGKIMIVVESPGINLNNQFRNFELKSTYRYPYREGGTEYEEYLCVAIP